MKREGALGVHSIDQFALEVPDLEAARSFYSSFGLDVRDEDGVLGLYTVGGKHRWATIHQGTAKRLRYLRFGLYADDLSAFEKHLDERGIDRIAAPVGAPLEGIWIAGFDALPINIKVAEKVAPEAKTRFEAVSSGPGESGAVFNSAAPRVLPRCMSHLAVFTTDVIAATRWYSEALGLRLSDGSGPVVAFLHGPHGSDHHLLALVASTHPGLHHASWDVGSVQEVGLGASQMMRAGYRKGWGVGRHVLGGNYFYYATDPWGSHCEYSADIDFIPHDVDWPAKADHNPEDSFYLWGPDVPEGFVDNTEPQGA